MAETKSVFPFRPLHGLFTAEKERNLKRDHARMHPDGLMRSGKICDICLLLAALEEAYRAIPRCNKSTPRGYRCSSLLGHSGPHSHRKELP